jgi:hypothetical protein
LSNWQDTLRVTLGDYAVADRLGLPYEGRGMLRCPAHEDKVKSLSYRWLSDGKLLLHCFAGCTWEQIRAAR